MEVGPLRLVPGSDGKLREVEGAWNEYANVIFSESSLRYPAMEGLADGERVLQLTSPLARDILIRRLTDSFTSLMWSVPLGTYATRCP